MDDPEMCYKFKTLKVPSDWYEEDAMGLSKDILCELILTRFSELNDSLAKIRDSSMFEEAKKQLEVERLKSEIEKAEEKLQIVHHRETATLDRAVVLASMNAKLDTACKKVVDVNHRMLRSNRRLDHLLRNFRHSLISMIDCEISPNADEANDGNKLTVIRGKQPIVR